MSTKAECVAEGTFYKQGHMTPTWTQRTFKIFTSKHLKYYDKTSEKGSVDISNIELVPGPAEHLRNSCSSKTAVAINVLPTDALGGLTASPLLFTVFDSKQEASKFVLGLSRVTKVHKLKEFLEKSKLDIPEIKFHDVHAVIETIEKEIAEEFEYDIELTEPKQPISCWSCWGVCLA